MFVYGGSLIPERSELAGLRAIAAADPTFELDDFLHFARSVHRNVHAAVANGTVASRSGVLDPQLARSLVTGRTGQRAWQHPVERLDHTAAIDATHGARDAVTVRFGARIGGRAEVEDWLFTRPAVVHGHLRDELLPACPSCGAPTAIDERGDCRFCATHLVGVAGDWKVTAVLAPRVLEAPGSLDRVADADLGLLGPGFRGDDFVAFARTIHVNVHRAVRDGKIADVHEVLTSEMRAALGSDEGNVVWGLAVDQISAAAVVDVQRGLFDVVTVRFTIADESGPYREDWTFERPGDRLAEPPTSCTFCGAAIDLDEEGSCRYCGTHLLGVGGDWRVADVRQPHEMVTHPLMIRAMQSRVGRIAMVVVLVGSLIGVLVAFVLIIAASW